MFALQIILTEAGIYSYKLITIYCSKIDECGMVKYGKEVKKWSNGQMVLGVTDHPQVQIKNISRLLVVK